MFDNLKNWNLVSLDIATSIQTTPLLQYLCKIQMEQLFEVRE